MATCSRTFTLNVSDDMPLDQAVYANSPSAGGAFIYGVRGGYVSKFNATTGARISSVRYVAMSLGAASIAYDSVSDVILCSYWADPGTAFNTPGTAPTSSAVFKLSPLTLAILATFYPSSIASGPAYSYDYTYGGPHRIISSADIIYGCSYQTTGTVTGADFFLWNVGLGTGTFAPGNYFGAASWYDLAINGTELWIAAPDDFGGGFNISGGIVIYNATTMVQQAGVDLTGEVVKRPWGITVNPSNGRAYLATRGQQVKRVEQVHTILADISLPSAAATPFCIRYNSSDGLIYVPGNASNEVYVINPSTDTVTATKTGFDSPFDVVFTPTKKWAVQQGSSGLKEIT